MPHADGLDELSAALRAGEVVHVLHHDCIHLPLRDDAGHLEVKVWAGHPPSVSLTVRGQWMDLGEIEEDLATHAQAIAQRLTLQLRQRGVEPVNRGGGAA
ncbi:hypothetical protein NYO99_09245 [Pelomonas sp. UHG3]|uniref:Uncharacterized protein n=1 Tax=Roseateles hydrophilus TaxID=2975054 RepID=A0ACC6C9Z6_9BURK|nr:hypothetical protein [Pelomonas sp. UHG3]MCY4745154.1 hypothetical protein [Pelomonas sp. UHG3]